jgi:phage gp36-like protein
MWFTKEELATHMNISDIDVITEGDDTLVTAAIDGATAEAKSYLGAFDTSTIFSAAGSNRNAILLIFVKDIAAWHLVVLSNYEADLEFREKRYNAAIAWLKGVQKGNITPDLPVADSSVTGRITYGSNEKREQHF